LNSPIFVFASIALIAGMLYLGQAFFVPLALAILLAFVLAPVVSLMERIGLGRTTSVITISVVIALLLAAMVGVASRELVSLVGEVPQYRENLVRKVKSLRGPLGSVERAADAVTELEEEIATPSAGERKSSNKPAPKVEVVSSSGLITTLGVFVGPLLDPLGLIALVVVLTIFLLLQHEDLRDRVIRLAGGQDLSLTTHALDDAGTRIGRYLGMQSLLAVFHGIVIAGGLALIGIPSAILWGVVAAFMRFVPYLGPWIAAVLPIAVAVGAFDSWTPALLTIGLIVVLEVVSNNVLEPWLYGSSVGLSPFAIIVSAVFWSWLWGLPGLLLATPLSACLVVLGRYVPGLEFLVILLSDEPALEPDVRLYQRLLARDLEEAETILREAREDEPDPDHVSDRLILPALRRLAESRVRGTLAADLDKEVHEGFAELLEEFADETSESKENATSSAARPQVLCVPALGASDELASDWVARVVRATGTRAITISADALLDPGVAPMLTASSILVCISALTPAGERRARIVAKRLSVLAPAREIVIGAWAAPVQEASDPQRRISRLTELRDRIRLRS
jgi:predicted PurR-regulated permease PerM